MENTDCQKATPEDIANIVFSTEPDKNTRFQIYCDDNIHDTFGIVTIFEIFATIFVEGMFKKNIKNVNKETILSLNPWLNMLGYEVEVEVFNRDEKDKVANFYSWVVLKSDPSWKQYFELSEIDKNYKFVRGGESPYIHNDVCTLKNLYLKFSFNNQEIYKISFKFV